MLEKCDKKKKNLKKQQKKVGNNHVIFIFLSFGGLVMWGLKI